MPKLFYLLLKPGSFISKLRVLLFIWLLTLISTTGYSQRFFSVVFDQLPKDFQLYARNDSSEAIVPITGAIEVPGWDHMSVVTYRNNERFAYNRSALQYASGSESARFSMTPKIKAELADYSFDVYACHAADSVLMVRRAEVVAGDFYLIHGQSNAAAIKGSSFTSKYCRTVARIPDDCGCDSAADTAWIRSGWSQPNVGYWGLELQRHILEENKIPTCVINGAVPGSQIIQHTPSTDPFSLYGHLLYRTRKSGATRIRAFFWLQGEEEALMGSTYYPAEFDKVQKGWQADYPMVDQFVVLQINIVFNPYYVAGAIRDFQRRTPSLYPKTTHFATIGLPSYDGVHYEAEGYGELARRLHRFIAPQIYQSPDNDNVSSPDIQKVFYSSAKKNEITLVFDENQAMRWPADTTVPDVNNQPVTLSLKNFFYLNGDESKPAPVLAGTANGNRVTLSLADSVTATKLNYLPSYNDPTKLKAFVGPYLTNKRGLPAFTFHEFAIADALTVAGFTVKATYNTVVVNWQPLAETSTYVLERRAGGAANFEPLKVFDTKTQSFEDTQVTPDITYTYRLKVISARSESPYAEASALLSPILAVDNGVQKLSWKTYPNPATQFVQVDFGKSTTGTLTLSNSQGAATLHLPIVQKETLNLDLTKYPAGLYLITVETQKGAKATKTIIKQ